MSISLEIRLFNVDRQYPMQPYIDILFQISQNEVFYLIYIHKYHMKLDYLTSIDSILCKYRSLLPDIYTLCSNMSISLEIRLFNFDRQYPMQPYIDIISI